MKRTANCCRIQSLILKSCILSVNSLVISIKLAILSLVARSEDIVFDTNERTFAKLCIPKDGVILGFFLN